jgi:hypothetical protein
MARTKRNPQHTARRLDLLDQLLDYALRSECRFAFCNGPSAPIRHHQTCTRCAAIHRAIRMGLVRRVRETYVRDDARGRTVVSAGVLEQFSARDGAPV